MTAGSSVSDARSERTGCRDAPVCPSGVPKLPGPGFPHSLRARRRRRPHRRGARLPRGAEPDVGPRRGDTADPGAAPRATPPASATRASTSPRGTASLASVAAAGTVAATCTRLLGTPLAGGRGDIGRASDAGHHRRARPRAGALGRGGSSGAGGGEKRSRCSATPMRCRDGGSSGRRKPRAKILTALRRRTSASPARVVARVVKLAGGRVCLSGRQGRTARVRTL